MKNHSPDFNRIETTLHHQEPDRVPLVEMLVDYPIMSQYLGREITDDDVAGQVEFWTEAGYDFVPLTVGIMRPGGITKDSQISKVIENYFLNNGPEKDDAWNIWAKPRIHTESDLETFPWNALANINVDHFYEAQEYLPAGMKIMALSGKIFTSSWMLMGFENLCLNLGQKPAFVQHVMDSVARIQLLGLKRIAEIPSVAGVWAVDDLAFGSGPILNPATYRKYLFPWYEEFGHVCRQNDLYFFFHTDGVIWEILEDLIGLGIDAIHPIDPTCLHIEEVKEKVCGRVAVIGNISNQILEEGTPEEVSSLVKHRLKSIAPGGGYLLGSGNTVPDWAKIENYRAMVGTCHQFGHYPITM